MKIPDTSSVKRADRRILRQVLGNLDPAFRARASARIVDRLDEIFASMTAADNVLLYAALPTEPDVWPIVDRNPEIRYALPRVLADEPLLECRTFADRETDLVAGAYGIAEPHPGACPRVPFEALDLIIVPGMAFTARGERLGKGGGYYDRLLGSPLLRARTVGVCFDCQIVETIAVEAHDQRVGGVVTEARVLRGK